MHEDLLLAGLAVNVEGVSVLAGHGHDCALAHDQGCALCCTPAAFHCRQDDAVLCATCDACMRSAREVLAQFDEMCMPVMAWAALPADCSSNISISSGVSAAAGVPDLTQHR